MRSAVGYLWFILVFPTYLESCTVHLESVNCSNGEISNVNYTCISDSDKSKCPCIFENPSRSEQGWYKMCKRKNNPIHAKKTRKRQVIDLENCEAIQPPRPGKASCRVSSGEIVCIGTCDHGFKFRDGKQEQLYSCRYSDGIWKPGAVFPECEPECIPPCRNGGNCSSPNLCSCPNEYRGESCQYPVELCGISKTTQASSWNCNFTTKETTCDISCHPPGTIEASIDIQRYVCDIAGVWSPVLPPCVEVMSGCEDPGFIASGRRFAISPKFPPGSSASYECDDGHVIVGNQEIKCLENGQWSSEKPRCVPARNNLVNCPKPHVPKNSLALVNFPDQRPLQTLFSSDLPLLQRLYVSMIANSSLQESGFSSILEGLFLAGTRVQYKCKSRFYKLYGSEYQTCLPSNTWSGYQPACVPECGKFDSPKTPFVVNGNMSFIGQWPWMVGLAMKTSKGLQLICGGVLISETWVLTAAHCVTKGLSNIPMDERQLSIHCGKHFRRFAQDDEYVQVRQVKQIIVHEEYDFIRYDVDIALLQLEDAVELTTRVQPICLPTEVTTRENIRDGKKGLVLGWGLTENGTFSDALRETVLPVVSHEICEEAYREGLRTVTVTNNMFCAGHESGFSDTCNGDSGGPFMFSVGPSNDKRWYLEGLVSWGSESGCAKARRYSGFTKVAKFVPWINMFI